MIKKVKLASWENRGLNSLARTSHELTLIIKSERGLPKTSYSINGIIVVFSLYAVFLSFLRGEEMF